MMLPHHPITVSLMLLLSIHIINENLPPQPHCLMSWRHENCVTFFLALIPY